VLSGISIRHLLVSVAGCVQHTPWCSDRNARTSSREIAELTGKLHKNVIRDIRDMLSELWDGSDLSHVLYVKGARGYTAEILLPRREVEILLTGYSIPLRTKVLDRLHELEAQVARPVVQLPDFTNATISL